MFGPVFRRLFVVLRFLWRVSVALFRFLFSEKSRNENNRAIVSLNVEAAEPVEDMATEKQLAFIEYLGGSAPLKMTKREASSLIDELLIQKEVRRMEIAQRRVERRRQYTGVGEVAVSFRVGCRYFDSTKNRVFECIALKGKRARSVAFGGLDSIERDKSLLKDFGGFKKTWIDGGAETCERGALRADRQATEREVAGELDFLRKLRQREKDYKPDVSFKEELSGG